MNMKMLKITRTDSLVRFRHEVKTESGVEERDVTAHEAPLKKFDTALQALAAVAAKMLELPAEYAKGILVHSLGLTYTKKGTRSATIYFRKKLDATDTSHSMDTPAFQIDDGGDGEDTRRQCAPKHAALVEEMITAAENYANGKRQQMQLPLEDRKPAEAEAAGQSKLVLLDEGRPAAAGSGDA